MEPGNRGSEQTRSLSPDRPARDTHLRVRVRVRAPIIIQMVRLYNSRKQCYDDTSAEAAAVIANAPIGLESFRQRRYVNPHAAVPWCRR